MKMSDSATETVVDQDIEEMLKDIVDNLTVKRLVLFNDDHHNQHEVAVQIIRAREVAGQPCTPEQAVAIMMQAHKTGQGIVLSSDLKTCQKAQAVLEAIGLGTDIID